MDTAIQLRRMKFNNRNSLLMHGNTQKVFGTIKFETKRQTVTETDSKELENENTNKINNDKEDSLETTFFDELYEQFRDDNKKVSMYELDTRSQMSQEMLLSDIWSLLLLNTLSLSNALETALIFAAKDENVQNIVYNELKECIESKKTFSSLDAVKCPQFRAFVHECLRLLCFMPWGISHVVTKPCILSFDMRHDSGCTNIDLIPISKENLEEERNATKWKDFEYILTESMSIDANFLLNSNIEEMNKVNLQNWLQIDEFGKLQFKNKANLMPFGFVGAKRGCIGKTLALKQIYSMLGNLMLRYKFSMQTKYQDMEIRFKQEVVRAIEQEIPLLFQKR